MNDRQIRVLVDKIRDTAATCFETVPEYQVMKGTREELSDKVIAIAWRGGTVAGFCSTVILKVDGIGDVLHLGLTCVRPEERSGGLTHILTSKAVSGYLIRHKPLIGKLWITNCAAVLSSLSNVAIHFEKVYPSPLQSSIRAAEHEKIAAAVDRYYRDKIYISGSAMFDRDNFVFRSSVKGTVFQKDRNEKKFYHRNQMVNDYYLSKMNFEDGDEVLQVGYASTASAVKHFYNKTVMPALMAAFPKKNTVRA
jgi:hypothetical protein